MWAGKQDGTGSNDMCRWAIWFQNVRLSSSPLARTVFKTTTVYPKYLMALFLVEMCSIQYFAAVRVSCVFSMPEPNPKP